MGSAWYDTENHGYWFIEQYPDEVKTIEIDIEGDTIVKKPHETRTDHIIRKILDDPDVILTKKEDKAIHRPTDITTEFLAQFATIHPDVQVDPLYARLFSFSEHKLEASRTVTTPQCYIMFGWNETHGYVDLMKHRLDYGSRDAYRPADGVEKYGMYCSMNGIKHAHDIAARQKNYAETMVNYFTHLAEVGATQLQHDSERDAYMYMTNYGRNVPQGCILM